MHPHPQHILMISETNLTVTIGLVKYINPRWEIDFDMSVSSEDINRSKISNLRDLIRQIIFVFLV